jgi:hypothetical protein
MTTVPFADAATCSRGLAGRHHLPQRRAMSPLSLEKRVSWVKTTSHDLIGKRLPYDLISQRCHFFPVKIYSQKA